MEAASKESKEEKMKSHLEQTADPYCFLSGKTKVTMCFSENGRTLEGQLRQYLIGISGL